MIADAIRVLYVDDELGLLEIAKLYLEESGEFSVTTIDSVSAALDLLGKEKFDVIISDYQMPGKDGIQFLVEVRTSFGKIPFILFTGKGREEVVIQAINSGADFYLQKGGEPESQFAELSHKTHSAVSQKRADEALLKSTEELHAAYEELAATETTLRANLDELTRQEQALRDSEEKFRSLAESSPDYIMRYDRQCRHMYMNPATLRVSGLSKDKIIGKTHLETGFDESQSQFWEEKITGVFETGKPYQTQFAWESVEGHIVLDWILTPEFNDDGTVLSVLGVSRDVTHLKKVEDELIKKNEELRESEAQKAAILDGITTNIAYVDKDLRILWVNKVAAQSVNKSPAEMIGHTCHSLWADPSTPCENCPTLRVFETKQLEYTVMHTPDGRVWDERGEPVFDETGNLIGVVEIAQDITERKRVEDELVSTQERLKEAHHLAHIGIWDWVIETDTVTWSEELCNVAGWDPLLPAPTFAELPRVYTPASWESLSGAVTRALTTGEPYNLELEMIQPDGNIRWTNAFGGVNSDKEGKIIGLYGTVQDITERKRAEEGLRESEEKLQSLFQILPVGVTILDKGLNIVNMNPMVEQILDLSKEGLIRGDYHQRCYIRSDGTPMPSEEYASNRAIAEQTVIYDVETGVVKEDGSIIWTSVSAVPLTNEDLGAVIVTTNITERKRKEEALQINENRLQMTQEIGHVGCWEYDIKTNLMWGSEEDCYLLGYPRKAGSFPIEDFASCITEPELVLKAFNDLIIEGKEYDLDFIINPKDGSAQKTLHSIGRLEKDEKGNPIKVKGINQDITEREVAEEALRQSENRYRAIYDQSPIAIELYDTAGTLVHVNNACLKLFGIESIKAIQNFSLFADPNIEDKHKEKLHQGETIHYQGSFDFEKVKTLNLYPTSREGIIWLDVLITPLGESVDSITGFLVQIQDITERKRAEEALIKSEEKFRLLTEKSVFGVIIIQDAKIVYANPSFAKQVGYPLEEIIGIKSLKDLLHPDDIQIVMKRFSERLEGRTEQSNMVYRAIRKDGSIIDIEVYGTLIDYLSRPGVMVTLKDITEQKKATKALMESESFNRGLVENLPDFIVIYGPDGTIHYVNPAIERALEYSAENLVGTHVISYVSEKYRDIVAANIAARQIGRKVPAYELDIVAYDGHLISVIAKGTAIQYHNRPAILLLLVDITRRKLAEEEIKSALKEKEVLLGEVHHRVKNNLTAIIGLIGLQISTFTDPVIISHFKAFEIRLRSMAIIYELLVTTKNFTQINLDTYMEKLVSYLFQVYDITTKIIYRIDMGGIMMPIETIIPCGLVVSEIITNSLKYAFPETFSGREERGEACIITISLQHEDNEYLLTVEDNGIGIAEGTDVSISHSLGLFLIRFIIEHQLQGNLEISTAGGTLFNIRFPESTLMRHDSNEQT